MGTKRHSTATFDTLRNFNRICLDKSIGSEAVDKRKLMALSLAAVDFVFLFCAVFPVYAPSYEARERPAYALQQLSIYGAIIVLLGYSQPSFLRESHLSFLGRVSRHSWWRVSPPSWGESAVLLCGSHLSCCPLCATPRLVIPSQPLPRSS